MQFLVDYTTPKVENFSYNGVVSPIANHLKPFEVEQTYSNDFTTVDPITFSSIVEGVSSATSSYHKALNTLHKNYQDDLKASHDNIEVVPTPKDVINKSLTSISDSHDNLIDLGLESNSISSELNHLTKEFYSKYLENDNKRLELQALQLQALERQNELFKMLLSEKSKSNAMKETHGQSVMESLSFLPSLNSAVDGLRDATLKAQHQKNNALSLAVSDSNEFKRENNDLLKAQSSYYDYMYNGDNSSLTWSGLPIRPAHAKASYYYERGKTEKGLNSLTATEILANVVDDDFNIFEYFLDKQLELNGGD